MPGTFHNLKFHLVFSTKHREPWLTPDIRLRVHEYLGGIIRGERGTVLEIGGVADHVHILFGWRTDESLSVLARNLKANSSRWIHETFPHLRQFAWQEGYSIFSVSQSQVEKVRSYIQRQEEHHRLKPFRDELLEFLRSHEVAFEEKYVFD
jgi:REP element-mobilizing transposase RayT